jgi:hypothetical protein
VIVMAAGVIPFRIAVPEAELADLRRRLADTRWPEPETVDGKELQRPSRRWAEKRFTDIRYWNEPAKGGHFAAFEQPELYVNEVRSFFRLVR